MEKRFYVDTSVWRDYFEDRGNGIRPLGEFAFRFLHWCKRNRHKIIVSDAIVGELMLRFTEEQINQIFEDYLEVLEFINETPEQIEEAESLWNEKFKEISRDDVLHAIIARENKAIIVSRDKHFQELNEIVDSKLPEEIM